MRMRNRYGGGVIGWGLPNHSGGISQQSRTVPSLLDPYHFLPFMQESIFKEPGVKNPEIWFKTKVSLNNKENNIFQEVWKYMLSESKVFRISEIKIQMP
jgi:hypothetical protein